MRLNLPWWFNPWAEVRRLRDEVGKHMAMEDKAVRSLWDVQSYAASELRAMRFELGRVRCEADAWREKALEIAATMPPPVHLVKKEDVDG